MFGLATATKFLGAHSIIALLAFLSDDVEIEKKLRHSVGDSHAETLEPQNRLVSQMGIYTSYLLDCKACLFVIRIVKNQTYVFRFMFGTKTYLILQLDGYVPQRSAPINTWFFRKIRQILPNSLK